MERDLPRNINEVYKFSGRLKIYKESERKIMNISDDYLDLGKCLVNEYLIKFGNHQWTFGYYIKVAILPIVCRDYKLVTTHAKKTDDTARQWLKMDSTYRPYRPSR